MKLRSKKSVDREIIFSSLLLYYEKLKCRCVLDINLTIIKLTQPKLIFGCIFPVIKSHIRNIITFENDDLNVNYFYMSKYSKCRDISGQLMWEEIKKGFLGKNKISAGKILTGKYFL